MDADGVAGIRDEVNIIAILGMKAKVAIKVPGLVGVFYDGLIMGFLRLKRTGSWLKCCLICIFQGIKRKTPDSSGSESVHRPRIHGFKGGLKPRRKESTSSLQNYLTVCIYPYLPIIYYISVI